MLILKSTDHQANSEQFTKRHQQQMILEQPEVKMFSRVDLLCVQTASLSFTSTHAIHKIAALPK
jgi:hypothetical protein